MCFVARLWHFLDVFISFFFLFFRLYPVTSIYIEPLSNRYRTDRFFAGPISVWYGCKCNIYKYKSIVFWMRSIQFWDCKLIEYYRFIVQYWNLVKGSYKKETGHTATRLCCMRVPIPVRLTLFANRVSHNTDSYRKVMLRLFSFTYTTKSFSHDKVQGLFRFQYEVNSSSHCVLWYHNKRFAIGGQILNPRVCKEWHEFVPNI